LELIRLDIEAMSAVRSNPCGEAFEGEPASRSASEYASASLRKLGPGLAGLIGLKPATGDEVTGQKRSPEHWVSRACAQGRSAEKMGGPVVELWAKAPRLRGNKITGGVHDGDRRGP